MIYSYKKRAITTKILPKNAHSSYQTLRKDMLSTISALHSCLKTLYLKNAQSLAGVPCLEYEKGYTVQGILRFGAYFFVVSKRYEIFFIEKRVFQYLSPHHDAFLAVPALTDRLRFSYFCTCRSCPVLVFASDTDRLAYRV